jgi:uncharacterized protein YjiK
MRILKNSDIRLFVFFIALTSLSACKHKVSVMKSPPHYNFSVVHEDKLDLKIKEVSGIVWDTDNNEFLSHNDESGKLFFLDRETKIIKSEIQFAGKGDYEDVAMANGIPYVLRSDGMLTKVIKDSAGKYFGVEAGKIGLSGSNDFETLYYDAKRNALIMICKNCAMDDKKSVSAFAYYPDSIGFDNKPVFTINAEEVKNLSPVKTSKFQPSAAAVHPVLNKLFIVSSASNLLVIADLDGNPEFAFYLSKKLFPQPEGITFKSNGDMYISNEGIASRGTLLKFIYKP